MFCENVVSLFVYQLSIVNLDDTLRVILAWPDSSQAFKIFGCFLAALYAATAA